MLRHHDLQFDFPRYQLPETPDWLIALRHWLAKAGPFFDILFWILAAAALAAILFYLGRILWRLRRPERLVVPDMRSAMADWRPTENQAHALLADADALAEAGRYAEAVHLLLRSIEDFEAFRPRLVQRANTAREIAGFGAMPESVRAAFAGIMDVVEKSRFGGHAVTHEDYQRCRAEYERFAFPEAWRSG
jgi:tetratricopeptide (TPR) repeat protein